MKIRGNKLLISLIAVLSIAAMLMHALFEIRQFVIFIILPAFIIYGCAELLLNIKPKKNDNDELSDKEFLIRSTVISTTILLILALLLFCYYYLPIEAGEEPQVEASATSENPISRELVTSASIEAYKAEADEAEEFLDREGEYPPHQKTRSLIGKHPTKLNPAMLSLLLIKLLLTAKSVTLLSAMMILLLFRMSLYCMNRKLQLLMSLRLNTI